MQDRLLPLTNSEFRTLWNRYLTKKACQNLVHACSGDFDTKIGFGKAVSLYNHIIEL